MYAARRVRSFAGTRQTSVLARSPTAVSNSLKSDGAADSAHAASIKPRLQILALRDVEEVELAAAVDDGLDAGAGDAHAAAHGQLLQLEQVQAQAAHRAVRDGAAAEGEVEVRQAGAAEGEDLGGRV